MTFVSVSAGGAHTVARRSDGKIVAWGSDLQHQSTVQPPPPGLGHVAAIAAFRHTMTHIGLPSRYVIFGPGCSGSMTPSRPLPYDTPRIGKPMRVRFDRLPLGAAFVLTGLSNTMGTTGPLPADLTGVGMPGCWARVRGDAVSLQVGTNNAAELSIVIPNSLTLLGITYYQQAFVPDPGVNPLGAVNSAAAAATVGH